MRFLARLTAGLAVLAAVAAGFGAPAAAEPSADVCRDREGDPWPCVNGYGWVFETSVECWLYQPQPSPPPTYEPWGGNYPNGAIFWGQCLADPMYPWVGQGYGQQPWPGWVPPPYGVGQDAFGPLWRPGGPTLDEVVAAALAQLQLDPVRIGIAPEPDSFGGRVKLPAWMWAENPDATTWGPQVVTVTMGAWTVTATAQVDSATWSMGDGSSVECTEPGVPYDVGYGIVDSPECGYRYSTVSLYEPGDRFTVTATSHWGISWEAQDGQTGSETRDTSASVQIRIGEVHVLIVG